MLHVKHICIDDNKVDFDLTCIMLKDGINTFYLHFSLKTNSWNLVLNAEAQSLKWAWSRATNKVLNSQLAADEEVWGHILVCPRRAWARWRTRLCSAAPDTARLDCSWTLTQPTLSLQNHSLFSKHKCRALMGLNFFAVAAQHPRRLHVLDERQRWDQGGPARPWKRHRKRNQGQVWS